MLIFKLGPQPHCVFGHSLVMLANNWTPHPTQLGSLKPQPRSILACNRWRWRLKDFLFSVWSKQATVHWLAGCSQDLKIPRYKKINLPLLAYFQTTEQNIRTQLIKTLFLSYFHLSFPLLFPVFFHLLSIASRQHGTQYSLIHWPPPLIHSLRHYIRYSPHYGSAIPSHSKTRHLLRHCKPCNYM